MFDLDSLSALVAQHGTVARVVVASVKGSTPREAGAAMFVWPDGQSGTIGGGTLEYQAADRARSQITSHRPSVIRVPLGPAANQCCGGAVTLVSEAFGQSQIKAISGRSFARRVEGAEMMPDQLSRMIERCDAMVEPVPLTLRGGWMVEPTMRKTTPVVIYGAGHVGTALAEILDTLPDFSITLADDRPSPTKVRWNSDQIPIAISGAPDHAVHFVMTHAHDLDLEICHRLLSRRNGGIGLIGSATKWARFRKRLQALGHTDDRISRITCPIGNPILGKHPQAIALGVATDLLSMVKITLPKRESV